MKRLDIMLVERGIIESRSKAANAIKNGEITLNGHVINKPSALCSENDLLEWNNKNKYVGRGSLKLQKAIDEFGIAVIEKRAMDIGASTGGFTQVLLDRGAETVYAVDVGHDQLDVKFRNDERVKVYEGINARYLDVVVFGGFDIITIDVSFISLKLILESAYNCLKDNGVCIALVKPQFESGKEHLNKSGIVTNAQLHINIINNIIEFSKSISFKTNGLIYSPIKGGKGNIEYLIYLVKSNTDNIVVDIEKTVQQAFSELS